MPEHEELQADIPAYVTSRLEANALERLERHLADCEICSEMAACWKAIAAGIREGGEDLFTPHPDPLTLKNYALCRIKQDRNDIARHVASCPSCELEIEAWKARPEMPADAARGARSRPGRVPRGGFLQPAFLVAAGLVLGMGLSLVVLRTQPHLDPRALSGTATLEHGGMVPLWVLPGPLRGTTPTASFTVPAGDPQVLIVVRPALPPDASPNDAYLWEIVATDGATVWSYEASDSQIRSSLETSDVATLAVPTAPLSAGTYELSLARISPGPRQGLLQIPFRVLPLQP